MILHSARYHNQKKEVHLLLMRYYTNPICSMTEKFMSYLNYGSSAAQTKQKIPVQKLLRIRALCTTNQDDKALQCRAINISSIYDTNSAGAVQDYTNLISFLLFYSANVMHFLFYYLIALERQSQTAFIIYQNITIESWYFKTTAVMLTFL